MSTSIDNRHGVEAPACSPSVSEDYTTDSVPLSKRTDPITMGLLWVTMVTGFPSVLIGFQWFKEGLSLLQVIGCVLASSVILLLYCVPSCMLGARSGLTYTLLSRQVFGKAGSWLVSVNMVGVCIAWYGLTALFLANALKGLYHWDVPLLHLSVGFAFLMAFNNFFGFSGIANFARYLAGPVLVLWVGYTFFKASAACPADIWSYPSQISSPAALTLVSSFVIGYSVWGNEADYWRFGKPTTGHIMTPLLVSLAIGELLFPVTGWLLARTTGITDYATATSLMNSYAFGGMSIVAAIVLVVTYFAVNDSSLYGAINAIQNISSAPRKNVVAWLAVAGSAAAALLAGDPKGFEDVASVSQVFLPSATVIIFTEYWLLSRNPLTANQITRVLPLNELPTVRWSAVIALVLGCTVGILTGGLIPGTAALHMGVPALQAWFTSLITYLLLRRIECKKQ